MSFEAGNEYALNFYQGPQDPPLGSAHSVRVKSATDDWSGLAPLVRPCLSAESEMMVR